MISIAYICISAGRKRFGAVFQRNFYQNFFTKASLRKVNYETGANILPQFIFLCCVL
jgi:hypothetical protein